MIFNISWVLRIWLALLSVFLLTACNPGTTVAVLGPGFVLDTAGAALTLASNELVGGQSSAFKQKKIIFDGEWKGVGYIRSGDNENCSGKTVPIHFKVEDGVAISLLRGSNLKFREPVDQDGDLSFRYLNASRTSESIGVMRKNDMQFWGRLYDGYGNGNFSLGGICKRSKWAVTKVDNTGEKRANSDRLDSKVEVSRREKVYDSVRFSMLKGDDQMAAKKAFDVCQKTLPLMSSIYQQYDKIESVNSIQNDWISLNISAGDHAVLLFFHVDREKVVCGRDDWRKHNFGGDVSHALLLNSNDDRLHNVSKKMYSDQKSIQKVGETGAGEFRPLAVQWEGYSEMFAGKVYVEWKKSFGRIEAVLPNNDGTCSGKYQWKEKRKGVWSIACTNGLVASGTMDGYGAGKGSSGIGEDLYGKKVSFTLGGK